MISWVFPVAGSSSSSKVRAQRTGGSIASSVNMRILLGATVTVLLAVWVTAQNVRPVGVRRSTKEPSPDRFNYFDVEMLQERARAESGNVVMSPASVKALLAMVLEGAGGRSAEQLRQALRIDESSGSQQQQLAAFFKSLQVHNAGYTVEAGNRLFVSNLVSLKREYQEAISKYYNADARQVDFSSPQITATTINDWVNDKTHGLIPRLVEPEVLNPYAKLMLVNAVYFKGKWKVPFDPQITSIKKFYPEEGVCHQAFYMEILGSYPYAYIKELNAQALELPYQGNKFTMLLVMPKDIKGINQLLRDLPYSPLQNILSKLATTDVLVSVPRFKMDYSADLVSSLSNMGITDIFGPNANLSGIFRDGNFDYITNVFHKAKIEVNEEGSIAGAGTGAIAVPLMGKQLPRFHSNRPFLFFIRDLETGSILFEGRVNVPDLASETCKDEKPSPPSTTKPLEEATYPQQPSQQFPVDRWTRPPNPNSGVFRPMVESQRETHNHTRHPNRTRLGTRRPSGDRDAIQFSNPSS